jgi:hypothetical protein
MRERRLPTPAGWLAFAAAFGLVVLAIGLLPSLLGSGEDGPIATTDTTAPVVTPSTITGTTVPSVDCSATAVEAPPTQEGLPEAVADVRDQIIAAALACDHDALVALAGDRFTTSFGGGGSEMFEEWESTGEGKLGILLKVLGTGNAVQTFDEEAAEALGSETLYVWPAAFARDTWDEITDEEMADLLTLYTQEELDEIAGFGSYAGWRTGITAEGDWVFFVAGD